MKRTTPERIQDIRDQINFILKATLGKTKSDFYEDYILVAAITRWFEIIGEATKYIPAELKQRYPDIPWKKWQECEMLQSMTMQNLILSVSGIR